MLTTDIKYAVLFNPIDINEDGINLDPEEIHNTFEDAKSELEEMKLDLLEEEICEFSIYKLTIEKVRD